MRFMNLIVKTVQLLIFLKLIEALGPVLKIFVCFKNDNNTTSHLDNHLKEAGHNFEK